MATVQAQLSKIATQADQRAKVDAYKQALGQILRSGNFDDLKAFVEHSNNIFNFAALIFLAFMIIQRFSNSLPVVGVDEIVVSRQILSEFAIGASELPADKFKTIATFALEKIQPKVIRFEEQVSVLRERLGMKSSRSTQEFLSTHHLISCNL